MFEKKKNLFANGKIRHTVRIKGALITDITGKVALLKAYRLQFDTFGHIVSGTQIHENKKPIRSMINGQINRHVPNIRAQRNYANELSLLARYIKNPETLKTRTPIYSSVLLAFDRKYEGKERHAVVLNRLFRNNKAEGLYKRIEELEGL
ncbi:hypothetical protein [Vibrio crassostreae]|uniref:hypothetical protein n=1 Tax=Vibrio crassostreae TaxID=246167 RepID=UPI001B304517|nr:hypothetical protein [Vibrio crassostreae]